MFLRMVEHNGQHERTGVLLNGHPFIREQNSFTSRNGDAVMVILRQFPRCSRAQIATV